MRLFRRNLTLLIFGILFIQLFFSCTNKRKPQLAFYHWTVAQNIDDGTILQETNTLRRFNSKQLFVKIMDIDWDNMYGVHPTTSFPFYNLYNSNNKQLLDSINITPVIFITVKALEQTDSIGINELAQKIVLKTNQLVKGKKIKINDSLFNGADSASMLLNDLYKEHNNKAPLMIDTSVRFSEIQLDCDWTVPTRQKYFMLLAKIKELLPNVIVSATLRLHQYKYPLKTGVPPVDELYLMCYNTGEVKNINEKNSIFDYEKAKLYFDDVKPYRKKLNFALPAFDWVIIFKKGHFFKIDNTMDKGIFGDTLITKLYNTNNEYVMLLDTVINNNFLRKGDLLKWEKITDESMQQAAQLCSKAINSNHFNVVFYDIDHINQTNYETIQKAFRCFGF